MPSRVEIINNPYANRVKILIDGNAPSAYSILDKYMNAPFLQWYARIFPEIYSELNSGSFTLHFVSTREEVAILRKIAEKYPYCVRFSSQEIVRKTPITDRLSLLSELIRNNRITSFCNSVDRTIFIIPDLESDLKREIEELEIRNHFYRMEIKTVLFSDFQRNKDVGDVTFLICPKEEKERYIQKAGLTGEFLILLSNQDSFAGEQDGILTYETSKENIFETIFTCIKVGPLVKALNTCIASLPESAKKRFKDQLEIIQSAYPRVIIRVGQTQVEKGFSIPIQFETDMPGYAIKEAELDFGYSKPGIILCNGQRVSGLQDGECILYVYRRGEKDPCTQMTFSVITRNRVTELTIEEQNVYLGEGDFLELTCTYNPIDADNINQMEWSSDNGSVVTVSTSGVIKGIVSGDSYVRVFCGRVSDSTMVHVLPHIRSIQLETDEHWLKAGTTIPLKITTNPDRYIEGGLKMSTMDARVANAVNGKLTALSPGVTRLVVQDKKEHVRAEATIHVLSEKDWKKRERELAKTNTRKEKKSFWDKLFG